MLLNALVFPSGVFADAYSQGEVNYNVSIDKKIRPINETGLYDNISKDQKIFVNDDVIDYNIVIENTGKDISGTCFHERKIARYVSSYSGHRYSCRQNISRPVHQMCICHRHGHYPEPFSRSRQIPHS